MKEIPWLSLSLLLAAYSTFSWALYRVLAPLNVLLLAVSFALLQALLLTTFAQGVRRFIRKWLSSDIGYFSVVALSAFSIAVFLVWFHVFEYVLMLVGAEILARLDLQNLGLNKWQALATLTLVSIVGIGLGWGFSYFFSNSVSL